MKKGQKRQFKVGEVVKFKSWDRMKREYGLTSSGYIDCSATFVSDMKHLCGTFATIKEFYTEMNGDTRVYLTDFTADGDIVWFYSTDMLQHIRRPRNIFAKNVKNDQCSSAQIERQFKEVLEEALDDFQKFTDELLELLKLIAKMGKSNG